MYRMAEWIETDEQYDVLMSLREVRHQIGRADGEVGNWKWAVIALASAANGALTCNLTGDMGVGALETRVAEQTIQCMQTEPTVPRPKPRLASPSVLLERAAGEVRIEQAGDTIAATETQRASFRRLFDFRSDFLHFKPSGWWIEISGMPGIFRDVLGIVRAVVDDGWAFRHLDDTERAELRCLCDDIETALDGLRLVNPSD